MCDETVDAGFVSDQQKFSTGDADLCVASRRYLSGLPASDEDPITAAFETADPAEAAFVEVTIGPLQTGNILMAGLALAGLAPDMTGEATATAVAGFTQYLCDITPLMMCNPQEDPGGGGDFTPIRGKQLALALRTCQGSDDCSNHWAPGDFAFLDMPGGALDPNGPCLINEGAGSFACSIAAVDGVTQCYSQDGVNARPGALGEVSANAINVRFDMFGALPGVKGGNPRMNDAFSPGPNVTKGKVPRSAACSAFDPAPAPPAADATVALPRDACFYAGSCVGGRFGNSSDSAPSWGQAGNPAAPTTTQEYWDINHSNDGVPYPGEFGTRYDLYMHEITHPAIPDKTDINPDAEDGNASCHANPSNDADRRVVIAAVINCIEHDVKGNFEEVPAIKFVKMFLTEPMEAGALYIEMLEEVSPGADDGVLHEVIQLYR